MKMTRSWLMRVGLGVFILWILLLVYPVRTGFTRSSILITFALWNLLLAAWLWRYRWLRLLPLVIPTVVGIFLCLPGRPPDAAALRDQYVSTLRSYAGVRYVWGGENWRGVDCSGLLRAALVDALMTESVRTINPALARRAVWLWWNDASAYDMGQGYQGLTRQLLSATRLRDATPAELLPGDLAVTADGSHVLAYLGDGRWIDADPYDLRVEEVAPDSPWWNMKVVSCRWNWLASQPP